MKHYEYKIEGHTFRISLSDLDGRAVGVEADGEKWAPTAEEMPLYAAVISLALLQYEAEEVHDEEAAQRITITPHESPWTDRAAIMKQRSL